MKTRYCRIFVSIVLMHCLASPVFAAFESERDELTEMLEKFLSMAHIEAAHERFWAEDLIYTSSSGERFGKAEILQGFEENSDPDEAAAEPSVVYSAEDVDIRVYGKTAVVAFRLVGRLTNESADHDVLYYFNTGTFIKRDGVWKVVAWQATKIPPQ